ncbi:MAG: hypothetical protein L0G94_10550 [Brachybacterium sp.]|uniref:hypothetical protein n=1 Tax=Brachybacterium sp. TaxID=1891286 RepID=UPI00264778B7|nr:hypothetical protein [Brachybacterium sp.]MDN5687095.1 hypothetical protein [Brachybacterium sp.]
MGERLDELEWLIDGSVWAGDATRRCGWGRVESAWEVARKRGRFRLADLLLAELQMDRAA